MKAKLLFLLVFTFCATAMVRAGDAPPDVDGVENKKKFEINGSVVHNETKKPLNNVIVSAYSSSKREKSVVTDGNGNYNFDGLKPGIYKIVFEKDGFKKATKEKVVVRADETFNLNIELGEHSTYDFMPGPFNLSDFE